MTLNKVICGSISKPNGTCVTGEAEKLLRKTVLDQAGQPVKQILDLFKK